MLFAASRNGNKSDSTAGTIKGIINMRAKRRDFEFATEPLRNIVIILICDMLN
jgi:hypothetical protein